MTKNEWRKPELVVLVRNRAEEAVLAACKGDGVTMGPAGSGASCRAAGVPCSAVAAS